MSYGFLGTFVDVHNKRVLFTAELNRLKSLNLRGTGTAKDEDYPDITTDVYYDYVGYYKKEILESGIIFYPYRKKEWNQTKNAYYLSEMVIGGNIGLLQAYEIRPSLDELTTFNEDNDDIIILYAKKIKKNGGQWYRYDDFSNAEEKIKEEYFKKRDELIELRKFRNTKEYFEMSEEGKNSYLSEVSYLEESVEDSEWEYLSIEYILNVFDFIKEDVGYPKTNEFGEKSYEWYYDDKRNVELYIEVD